MPISGWISVRWPSTDQPSRRRTSWTLPSVSSLPPLMSVACRAIEMPIDEGPRRWLSTARRTTSPSRTIDRRWPLVELGIAWTASSSLVRPGQASALFEPRSLFEQACRRSVPGSRRRRRRGRAARLGQFEGIAGGGGLTRSRRSRRGRSAQPSPAAFRSSRRPARASARGDSRGRRRSCRRGDRVVELRRLGFEISSEGLKPRARYSEIDGFALRPARRRRQLHLQEPVVGWLDETPRPLDELAGLQVKRGCRRRRSRPNSRAAVGRSRRRRCGAHRAPPRRPRRSSWRRR